MRIACLPADLPAVPGTDHRFDLYVNSRTPGRGRVGDLVPGRLRRLGLAPRAKAWDFASIAMAVVAADETAPRGRSPDGWTREIALTVAVNDPAFWSTQTGRLVQALGFLSGDIWSLEFAGGGVVPAPPRQSRRRPEDMVCLLSGGMDSLIGAIDCVRQGHTPLLVSQMAKGDTASQARFASAITNGLHLQLNHHARPPIASERSQRARSIAFLGFGVLAASCLQSHQDGATVELRIPENGFISQNVPLTPLRTGTLSTRTTHPHYLALIQDVLDDAQLRVTLHNPYDQMTKGEMLKDCADQALLARLVDESTSCGRFSRTGFQHCGRCVPCQVRRASYLAWGHADNTRKGYRYAPLGQEDARHAYFDDVRSVAMAIETVRRHVAKRHHEVALLCSLLGETSYVGEIGIDGSPPHRGSIDLQASVFDRILGACAAAGGRVISIHSRGAATSVLDGIERRPGAGVPILHWFSGTMRELAKADALGCWFSVGPAMLRSRKGRELAAAMPVDRMLTETDAPFGRNGDDPLMPWQAYDCLGELADLKGVPIEALRRQMIDNLRRLPRLVAAPA